MVWTMRSTRNVCCLNSADTTVIRRMGRAETSHRKVCLPSRTCMTTRWPWKKGTTRGTVAAIIVALLERTFPFLLIPSQQEAISFIRQHVAAMPLFAGNSGHLGSRVNTACHKPSCRQEGDSLWPVCATRGNGSVEVPNNHEPRLEPTARTT